MRWRDLLLAALLLSIVGIRWGYTPSMAASPTATPNYKATISALETQVAGLSTPTPRATSTPTPRPTLTPTLSVYDKYPRVIADIARQDSPMFCDRIGWGISASGADFQTRWRFYSACGSVLTIAAICVKQTDSYGVMPAPRSGNQWILCSVSIGNHGVEPLLIGPTDFRLISVDGVRFSPMTPYSLAPHISQVLYDDLLPPDQFAMGWIGFEVWNPIEEPVRLEMNNPFVPDGTDEPLIIIIERLEEFGSPSV